MYLLTQTNSWNEMMMMETQLYQAIARGVGGGLLTDLTLIVHTYLTCCCSGSIHKEKPVLEGCPTCTHDICECSKKTCSFRYCGAIVHPDCSPAAQFN